MSVTIRISEEQARDPLALERAIAEAMGVDLGSVEVTTRDVYVDRDPDGVVSNRYSLPADVREWLVIHDSRRGPVPAIEFALEDPQ